MTLSGIFELIGLLYTMDQQATALIAAVQAKEDDDWFNDSAQVLKQLQSAQTPQELSDASTSLAKLIRNI